MTNHEVIREAAVQKKMFKLLPQITHFSTIIATLKEMILKDYLLIIFLDSTNVVIFIQTIIYYFLKW